MQNFSSQLSQQNSRSCTRPRVAPSPRQVPVLLLAPGAPRPPPPSPLSRPRYKKLLEEFPLLLRPSAAPPKPLHGVVHHIDTGSAAPVFARPWGLDPEKHRIAEEEFLALEKAGIISRSNSPWASPLHLVPKKDGSWRPCGNCRRLNDVTIPDRYPLPNMQSLNDRMAGCTVFSQSIWSKPTTKSPLLKKTFQRQQ